MVRLRLGRTEIIQLLGSVKFYEQCTAYLFLEQQGLAAVQVHLQAAAAGRESCCDDVLAAPLAAFARITDRLADIPGGLEPLRAFLSAKLQREVQLEIPLRIGARRRTVLAPK